ncbi:MAG: hypothetical protein WBA40_27345 [Roseiarcus sp.]
MAGLIALPEQGFAGRKRFDDLADEKVLERWREIGWTDGRMKCTARQRYSGLAVHGISLSDLTGRI